MLQRHIQQQLISSYIHRSMVKKAFDKLHLENAEAKLFLDEKSSDAAILYVDIAGFSNKVTGLHARNISEYLRAFYSIAIPVIYDNGGQIDRIMGDGIIAVFSHALQADFPENDACVGALRAARTIVEMTYGSDHASKAALSYGNVSFCITGLATVYEDYTIVGNPLTEVYRLEAEANENQIVFLRQSPIGTIVNRWVRETKESVAYQPATRIPWVLTKSSKDLRGVGNGLCVYIKQYQP